MQQMNKKVAVITGGSSGIGLASARALIESGAKVCVFARSKSDIDKAVSELGPNAHGVSGSISSMEDLDRLFREARERLGAIDILVAAAAQVKLAPIAESSESEYDEIMAVDLKGAFFTLQRSIPYLNDRASVVMITSWLSQIGFPGSSLVSMSKAGLRALVRVAAAELSSRNIRVNAVSPGAIETPLWGKLGLPAETLQQAGAAITAQIPFKRWGAAAEVARVVRFLASDEASYINGTEIAVDGGLGQV